MGVDWKFLIKTSPAKRIIDRTKIFQTSHGVGGWDRKTLIIAFSGAKANDKVSRLCCSLCFVCTLKSLRLIAVYNYLEKNSNKEEAKAQQKFAAGAFLCKEIWFSLLYYAVYCSLCFDVNHDTNAVR